MSPRKVAGTQRLGSSAAACCRPLAERHGLELEQSGHELGPISDAAITDGSLTCYISMQAPTQLFALFLQVIYMKGRENIEAEKKLLSADLLINSCSRHQWARSKPGCGYSV